MRAGGLLRRGVNLAGTLKQGRRRSPTCAGLRTDLPNLRGVWVENQGFLELNPAQD